MSIASELAALEAEGLLRRRRVAGSPCEPEMAIDGRTVLSFASNDYLGLAADPRLIDALAEGARAWGVGAGASHFLGGHFEPHAQLEERLAAFVGAERALLFSTGYMANIGILPALAERGDVARREREQGVQALVDPEPSRAPCPRRAVDRRRHGEHDDRSDRVRRGHSRGFARGWRSR